MLCVAGSSAGQQAWLLMSRLAHAHGNSAHTYTGAHSTAGCLLRCLRTCCPLLLQVCTGVMVHGYPLVKHLCGGLQAFMSKHGFSSINEFRGAALPYFTTHTDLVARQKAAIAERKATKVGLASDTAWTGGWRRLWLGCRWLLLVLRQGVLAVSLCLQGMRVRYCAALLRVVWCAGDGFVQEAESMVSNQS